MKNVGQELTCPNMFFVPSIRPDGNLDTYEAKWSESGAAYLVKKRPQVPHSQRVGFPIEQTMQSLDDFLATKARQATVTTADPQLSRSERNVDSQKLQEGENSTPDSNMPISNTLLDEQSVVESVEESCVRGKGDLLTQEEAIHIYRPIQHSEQQFDVEIDSIDGILKLGFPTHKAQPYADNPIAIQYDHGYGMESATQTECSISQNLSNSSHLCLQDTTLDEKDTSLITLKRAECRPRCGSTADFEVEDSITKGNELLSNTQEEFEDICEGEVPYWDASQVLRDARELAKEVGIIKLTPLRWGAFNPVSEQCSDTIPRPERYGALSRIHTTIEDRKAGWHSPVSDILDSLVGAPDGGANPYRQLVFEPVSTEVHHLNYSFGSVLTKTATPPEVSLWAVVSTENRQHTNGPSFTRQSILTAEAMKYVDPVYYDGPSEILMLSGSKLRDALTGRTYKCYPPVGNWNFDWYEPEENVPYGADPNTMYWNWMSGPPLPQPFIFEDSNHLPPNVNSNENCLWPSKPEDWKVRRPSPLRQVASASSISDDAFDANKTEAAPREKWAELPLDDVPDLASSSDTESDMFASPDSGRSPRQPTPESTSEIDGTSPGDGQICNVDLEHLPDLEDCEVGNVSKETRNLVALVKALKGEFCTSPRGSESEVATDTHTVCEAQTMEEIDQDNSFIYGILNEEPHMHERSNAAQSACVMTEEVSKMLTKDEGVQEQTDEGCAKSMEKKPAEEVASPSEGSEDLQGKSIRERSELKESTTEAHDGASIHPNNKPLPIGRLLCYGAAAVYVGICVYNRLRRAA